jgi:amino acid transporter
VALTFGAAALAYTIGRPDLAKNGVYVGIFCIVAYCLSTWVVLQGVEVFARIANWTFVIGTIVPGVVLLALLGYWISSGHPLGWQHLNDAALSQDGHARFWPAIHSFGTISFLAGIVLLFAGVEVQAVHVIDMRSPSRGYPAAIGLGALISVLIFALGASPIAAILPYEKISLQSGVFDAFGAVLADIWHMGWAVSGLSPIGRFAHANHVTLIATTVAAITLVATQPRIRSAGGSVRPDMMRVRIERCIMTIITGTATTPLSTALQ